jgi:hypothetical protein
MLFEVGHEGEHGSALGLEYLINDAGYITSAAHFQSISGQASSWGPAPTLVHSRHSDLEVSLVWDNSVLAAPDGFTRAVIAAAKFYVGKFAAPTAAARQIKINIHVGYAEVGGSPMAADALGESESYGYLTDYATVTNALRHEGYSFAAANEPTTSQFFVTSAEAKALGLVGPKGGLDGFVGFSNLSGTGFSWNLAAGHAASSGAIGANQFSLKAIAWHEISEVMGRIGMEGEGINGQHTYTPLDLFDFKSPGELALSPRGGYFSIDNGATGLGVYNNSARNGADIADWASSSTILQSRTWGLVPGHQDAYDAFNFASIISNVSAGDIAEDAALGYASLGLAEAVV